MEHKFVTYLRTMQFKNQRFKGNSLDSFIYVNPQYLKTFNIENDTLQRLIAQGEIVSDKPNEYKAIKAGVIDFSLLPKKRIKHTVLTKYIQEQLLKASFPFEVNFDSYFNVFLSLRNCYLDHFFTIDEFSGRIHTPISALKKEHRVKLLINENSTTSIDIVTAQPLLLGKILKSVIGDNDFSHWIDQGVDVYEMFKDKLGLKSRNDGKKEFFPLMYGYPNQQLEIMFNNQSWIKWINNYKSIIDPRNPNSNKKPHSNLAWLLQKTEVMIMSRVWERLMNASIPFLTVHDEVIVPKQQISEAKNIFDEVFNIEFPYYKLNIDKDYSSSVISEIIVNGFDLLNTSSEIKVKIDQRTALSKEELIPIAENAIGPFNNLPKDKIPFFEELLQFRIIEEGLNNNFYLSNSTPF